jgi:TRAP-type C4-dicarboxylate transport system substrate-binding protein
MKSKSVVIGAAVVGLSLALGPTPKAWSDGPIVLKYADPSKANTSRTQAAEETMREIEKRTGGRVKHEFYWSQSLLKSKDVLMGIKSGTCDVGDATAVLYHPSRFPVWQFIQNLFVGGPDQRAVTKACNELYDTNPIAKKEFDDSGLQLLTTSALTPTILISKKPLRVPDDFKGVRIRAVGTVGKLVAAMGGTPNPMKFYEVPEALARGVLDGTQSYLYASHAYKHYEYCKYLLLTPPNHIIIDYWINPGVLAKMPPDVRKIYLETWRTVYVDLVVKYHEEERAKQIKDMEAAGVTFYKLTPDELTKWKEAAEPINQDYYDEMAKKGIDGKKIVEQYQALYDKYEGKM